MMGTPILTFFNNKGGVGKTSLVYHLAWMYALLGKRILAVDLDPQANLTAALLSEDEIEALWDSDEEGATIYRSVLPLTHVGDIASPRLRRIHENLHLIPGDVMLSSYEDVLSGEWPKSMDDSNLYRPIRILSSFWIAMEKGAAQIDAELILVDTGPNLGAINRSVLISTDYVAIPLAADLFSLQGLRNLGPSLKSWKNLWRKRRENWDRSREKQSFPEFELPEGKMTPIGYLCQQPSIRLDHPVKAYDKWVRRMPEVYHRSVLDDPGQDVPSPDPEFLATIKHYRSLVPMGREKRKPIFQLTPADGASGSHAYAVQSAYRDFKNLAGKIASRIGLPL